jgi:hypothetical protein
MIASNHAITEAAIAVRPLAEGRNPPVETERQIYKVNAGTAPRLARSCVETIRPKEFDVNTSTKDDKGRVPPAVISAPPEKELEKELQRHPDAENAKVDVGSDESMDASDPSAASQPGSGNGPVPSSGFPEKDR